MIKMPNAKHAVETELIVFFHCTCHIYDERFVHVQAVYLLLEFGLLLVIWLTILFLLHVDSFLSTLLVVQLMRRIRQYKLTDVFLHMAL